MSRENIKLRVREILAQKGMDCTDLAQRMGKSPQYVNNVLNKRKDMSLNALAAIADALEVEFGDLFSSSFTPGRDPDGLRAVVTCPAGVFTATGIEQLRDIVETLSGREASLTALCRRTLERALRFPDGADRAMVTELMANLSRTMHPDSWNRYWNRVLKGLLPQGFTIDRARLESFMTEDEIRGFLASLE